ncbi:hypothetical protein GC175_24420 [bacterium]|nr:hypothetical protein [bacterium]
MSDANEFRCGSLQEHVAAQRTVVEYTVGDGVILAGQPQPEDLPELARQGVRSVINLRRDVERSDREANNAAAAGLDYLHLPLPAYELEPQHLVEFQDAIGGKEALYIHCRSGSRVALLWMLHRIINQGWSRDVAEAELRSAGYTEESMDVFTFCADDYFERVGERANVA